MDLSVVVPAFNEAPNVEVLYQRVCRTLAPEPLTWELVFVDDGSQDGTFEVVADLHRRDGRVQGLRLSRNFGHQLALLAGLQSARGDAIITLDADLQQPPELIPQLVAEWRKGYAIVHTIPQGDDSDRSAFKRWTSRLFYKLFRRLSGIDLRPGMADYRLLDRRAARVLAASNEHRPFLRGLSAWMGFPQTTVSFHPGERLHGASRYTIGKMLRLALCGIVSFSEVPLYFSLVLGVLGIALSVAYGIYSLVAHFVLGSTIRGWTSTVVLMTAFMSVQLVMLGILGIYVGEILQAVRGRPNLIIDRSTQALDAGDAGDAETKRE
jgi:polyisoprenyl-phosphate glycosyltransferase